MDLLATTPTSPSYPGASTGTSSHLSHAARVRADAGQGTRFIPGTLVAERYRIIGLLGQGGMGEVYRADDLKLGQPVALKFLPEGLEADRQWLERFLDEVRLARQVTHPNVCRVYDIGEVDGQHFLSMEYVDGEDLASLLRRIGRLPRERAVTVARQICAGLAAAHEQNILHRDLKPANVMIDGRGHVRLTDFGLAGIADSIGQADVTAGTPAYMAPEQLANNEVTIRSDIYSLGLVLYEIFTGQSAYRPGSLAELKQLHDTSTPSSLSSIVENIDPAVERAVLRCLENDPAKRPASVLAVSAALPGGDPLAAALAAGETPSPELVAEAGKREAMRPVAAILLALCGMSLFLGATYWAGTMSMLHFLPLDKQPEVLIDRAQGVLAELGFTEPVYSEPVDQAWGMFYWNSVLNEVTAADSSRARWDLLRERSDAAVFWYRQSPRLLLPEALGIPILSRGEVWLMNPTPASPGEAMVLLDMDGRLRRVEVLPKRFSTREEPEPEWSQLFELAGLDTTRFAVTRPRYQRFLAPDQRRAWLGTRVKSPSLELRVEVGSFEGRPILFNVATSAGLEELGEDPTPQKNTTGELLLDWLTPVVILVILILALQLARRNLNQGRADHRGALRFAVLIFTLYMLANSLRSHALFSTEWAAEIWTPLVGAVFMGLVSWGLYNAAEPLGRQVWPVIFISANRLLSLSRTRWRDPLLGKSVLIGVIFGSIRFLIQGPLNKLWYGWLGESPPRPYGYNLEMLLGQRQALAWILDQALTIGMCFLLVTALVVIRRLVKRRRLTLVIAVVLWTLINGVTSLVSLGFGLVLSIIAMAVLLRWGLIAMVVSFIVAVLAWYARTTDWSAWHAQSAVMTTVVVALLAIYGMWAATGARASRSESS